MKVLLASLLIVYSVKAIELGSFIPLHFACVDQSVHTDFGVVDARLDVFKKGTTFNAQLILSKDNAFLIGFKQASTATSELGVVRFIPQGHAFQIAQAGDVIPLTDAAILISQSPKKEIQIRFNSQAVSPFKGYTTVNCR